MEAKEFNDHLSTLFFEPLKKHGFVQKGKHTLLKEENRILQRIYIQADFLRQQFTGSCSVMPLFMLQEGYVLEFGDRIPKLFDKNANGSLYAMDECESRLRGLMNMMELEGLPWLNRVKHPDGLERFIKDSMRSKTFYKNKAYHLETLVHISLERKDLKSALAYVKLQLDAYREDIKLAKVEHPFMTKNIAKARNVEEIIKSNDLSRVEIFLEESNVKTIENLKLSKVLKK